jgi:hypothetical protein
MRIFRGSGMTALLAVYNFPPPTPFQSMPMFWAVHAALLLLAAGSVAALFVRSRKPARLGDLFAWLGLILLGLVIAVLAGSDRDHGVFLVMAGLFVSLVALTGLILTFVRYGREDAPPPQFGTAFGLLLALCIVVMALLPAVPTASEAARRTQCRNNLRQIGLALFNYVDVSRDLPLAKSISEPVRSWRVEVLPYLDGATLRKKYRDDLPWDASENDPVSMHIPQPFACPSMFFNKDARGRHYTAYSAIMGASTAFSDAGRKKFPTGLADGASQTLLVVEACGRDIVWTEPRDVDVDADPIGINLPGAEPKTSPGIGSSYHAGGAQALIADGSVKFFSQQIDPTVLKALTTIAGGEKVGEF